MSREKLIADAAEAQERFGDDDLELFAAGERLFVLPAGSLPKGEVVKTCACGAKISRILWARLPKREQETSGEVLDFVECPACRSTLALPRDPPSR